MSADSYEPRGTNSDRLECLSPSAGKSQTRVSNSRAIRSPQSPGKKVTWKPRADSNWNSSTRTVGDEQTRGSGSQVLALRCPKLSSSSR